jgi:polyhydroxybutyrate depolymerase
MRLLLAIALLLFLGIAPRAETLVIGGVARSYSAILPAQQPAPLVLVLHGNLQQGADMMKRTSWPDVARREGLLAVFPDGRNRAWADGRTASERPGRVPPAGTDDVTFLVALAQKYIDAGLADPKRIYVTGVSNGGMMALALACNRADFFAAAALVIASFTRSTAASCHPVRPMPILIMNGTADPLIPYDGGRGTSRFASSGYWSTPQTVDFWRRVGRAARWAGALARRRRALRLSEGRRRRSLPRRGRRPSHAGHYQ